MSETTPARFGWCTTGHHAACPRHFTDQAGHGHRCGCPCHTEETR